MSKQLPKAVNQFRKRHPKVWKAFNELGERCHEAGPIGGGLEGVTHSAVRNARKAGITRACDQHSGTACRHPRDDVDCRQSPTGQVGGLLGAQN